MYGKKNCQLQIGGNDQWGNILSGTELVGKIEKTKVHGLTTELLLNERGEKFGKSEV
jgi:tyrosyl-tRNA synthetase